MKIFTTPNGTELPILQLKGKDYLQVAQRLVWFREEHPDWTITTEAVALDEKHAIFKAWIQDTSGRTIATAHKREDQAHFGDCMEKAETGAIGRALAYCGYGTQFCADELCEAERIVDAPIEKAPPKAAKPVAVPAPKVVKSVTNATPAPSFDEFEKTQGEYRVTFGVYKDKTLDQMGEKTAKGYAQHLANDALKRGGEMSVSEGDFIRAVKAKYNSVTS
jgi:hypothetical protein